LYVLVAGMGGVGAAVTLGGLGGCARSGLPAVPLTQLERVPNPEGTRVEVVGDWNDVNAALDLGLSISECSVLKTERSADGCEQRHELLTIDHLEGSVVFRRERADPSADATSRRQLTVDDAIRRAERMDPVRGQVGDEGRGAAAVEPAARASEPEPISITVRLGPEGDKLRERRLAEAIAARLETLRGRDYAPIRNELGIP
jgi:hypothetical protein